MGREIGRSLFVSMLVLIVWFSATVLIGVWEHNVDSEILSQISTNNVKGLKSVRVYFQGSRIYLDIHANHSLSCDEAIGALDIDTILVRSRKYFPNCEQIDENFVRIVYIEGIHE